MSSLDELFNCLEENQIKYNHNSLSNDSLLENKFLEGMELYNFKNDMSIWNILYYIKHNLELKTPIEQDKLLRENNSFMLDEFDKDKQKLYAYVKGDIIESIKKNTNNSLTSKLFLANYYNINLYVYYNDIDICIKFSGESGQTETTGESGQGGEQCDGNNEYLIVITKNKAFHYYDDDDDYTININDHHNVIEYDELKNYKKYKIDELREFCTKLKIDLYSDSEKKKKKIKKVLIENIQEKYEIIR